VGSPLARPEQLPALPPIAALSLDELIARAAAANPELGASEADVTAAERMAELTRRNWYPDLTLGLSVFDAKADDGREFGGYEAMVAFDIPLQWGLREARVREAKARLSASRARRAATSADLQARIAEAWWRLDAATRGLGVLRRINIPQAGVLLRSSLASYQLGQADLPSVLLALQGVRRTELDQIALQTEQQTRLAEIEKLTGGPL
jgi:outer membrane protein TolC